MTCSHKLQSNLGVYRFISCLSNEVSQSTSVLAAGAMIAGVLRGPVPTTVPLTTLREIGMARGRKTALTIRLTADDRQTLTAW